MNSLSLLRLIPVSLLSITLQATRVDARSCCQSESGTSAVSSASLYQLPLHFQDDHGNSVTFSALAGKPVVVAMFFASCPSVCPALVGELKSMQERLPPSVRSVTRFVLVSFDSEHDQPAVLAAYRASHHLDSNWVLLHGDDHTVRQLAALLGVSYQRQPSGMFRHTTIATVLNAQGDVIAVRPGLGGSLRNLADALAASAFPTDCHPAS